MFGNTMICIRTKKLQTNVRHATKKILMFLQVLHLMAFMVQVTEQSDCGTYRAENGKICRMCSAGNYKIGDCMEDGMPARCLQCPSGTYQTTCNQAQSCALCSPYCQYYFSTKVSECNAISDIKCQCQPGFHFEGEVNGKCIKHKSCPPSQGVKMQGTPLTDTMCESCISGKTFSNVSSSIQQCQNCTTCPTISECTPVNDTVCAIDAVKPDNAMDQHGLSIGHIVGIVGACVVGIIVMICVAVAVGYYRLHRNHPGKPRNPDGECPQEAVELAQAALPETYQVAHLGANLIAPPSASPVAPPAAIQDAPPAVSQVAPLVAGQVANDFIYRRNEEINGCNAGIPITEDQLDIERSTEGDTVVDAGPISVSDVHLHNRHFKHLSERQDTPSHGKSSVSSNTELKQIAHGPRNVLQHEQPGATGQDSLAVTPNNIGNMDHHKGPTGNNTWAIPTEKAVPVISEKEVPALFLFLTREIVDDFLEFFRFLVPLTVKPNHKMPNVEGWIQEEKRYNSSKVTEVHYQLLTRWKSHRGGLDDKFCNDIKKALRNAGKNETLAKLEQEFSEYFPHH